MPLIVPNNAGKTKIEDKTILTKADCDMKSSSHEWIQLDKYPSICQNAKCQNIKD